MEPTEGTIKKLVVCYNCGGHGQVPDYGPTGENFYGAKECNVCFGTGELTVKGGALFRPDGKFAGRLPKQEGK